MKAISKLWQCFGEYIEHAAQRVRAFSSKLRQRFREHIEHAAQRMRAFSSELRQRFKEYIEHATQRVQAFSSKLRRHFREHIDDILIRIVLLLVALAVAVMVSESVASCLRELLGLEQNEKYKVLKTIGFCIVGVLLVLQALAANKRAKAMEDTAREQANATKNTEKGQRQERLKNAIEHLGHNSNSVRMGGAHELFHLAEDTEKLRQTLLDILCAHIRQTTGGDDYQKKHKTKPSEEIQGLLTLLFVQEHDVFKGCSINLQGSYLNGATLIQARLKRANLWGAHLQGADLMEARLQEANLRQAQLQKANLWGAHLQGAKLWEAQMQGAGLRQARLQRAGLSETQLQGANLWMARLQGATLWHAQMQGAVLYQARLQWADLSKAQMQEADLRYVQLQGANFFEVQLQGANLMEAKLQGAIFEHVQLQGAKLYKAQLQGVSSLEAGHLPSATFEIRIRNRIGELSDLTGIIFIGGLREEDLDTLCEDLSDDQAQALREKLVPHVGKPASHELTSNSGAETSAYNQEEAEQWIAEYNKTMEEAPSADDTADADSTPNSSKSKGD